MISGNEEKMVENQCYKIERVDVKEEVKVLQVSD